MARLSGKSAVVTGGASGIGKAIAQLFLEEGAQVVIADINGVLLEKTAKELAGFGPVSSIVADVRAMADAGRIVQRRIGRRHARDVARAMTAGLTAAELAQLETICQKLAAASMAATDTSEVLIP